MNYMHFHFIAVVVFDFCFLFFALFLVANDEANIGFSFFAENLNECYSFRAIKYVYLYFVFIAGFDSIVLPFFLLQMMKPT